MFSKGSGLTRGCKHTLVSGESFVNEIMQEANRSIVAEKDVSEAFRQLCSAQVCTDTIKHLPTKVLSVYLSAKFDQQVLAFVTSSLTELATLPNSLRDITVAKFTGLSVDEVSIYLYLIIFFFDRI